MEVSAFSKSVRVSPRKVRLVADGMRNLTAQDALNYLDMLEKRGSESLMKTLQSAVANAVNNLRLSPDELKIKSVEVNEATAMKRFRPSTRGRVHPYKRKGSHIRIILEGVESKVESKEVEVKVKEEDKGEK